jgi:hypothetical protein
MSYYFNNQTKFTLSAPIRVNDLGIVSGQFNYIKPSNATGFFTGTIDGTTNQMTYDTTTGDINEQGTWKIWASFTDGNGRFNRANTTNVEFKNESA